MDTKPDLLYLEKKTTLTLDDRFSKVTMKQLPKRKVLFKGRHKSMRQRLRNVLRGGSQGVTKPSVWTRIGWDSRWRRGVWNFRNKYHRLDPAVRLKFSPAHRSRCSSAHRGRFGLKSRFNRRRKRNTVWSRLGGASAAQRCDIKTPPTKQQLDLELDQYMSLTRSRLDQQLEEYMSMSRHRLDAELDEYMAMAGQRPAHMEQDAVSAWW